VVFGFRNQGGFSDAPTGSSLFGKPLPGFFLWQPFFDTLAAPDSRQQLGFYTSTPCRKFAFYISRV
jgi:hypothetical protein